LGDTRQLAEAPRAGLSEEYAGRTRAGSPDRDGESASSGLFGTLFTPYSDYRMIMYWSQTESSNSNCAANCLPAYRATWATGPLRLPCCPRLDPSRTRTDKRSGGCVKEV
jgi:hypothetical protein